MNKKTPENILQAIIIGSRNDVFVERAKQLLSDKDIACAFCADIYAATALLAKAALPVHLVVTRFDLLTYENGTFFEKLKKYGCVCCCLIEAPFDLRNRQLLTNIFRDGGYVLSNSDELERTVDEFCSEHTAEIRTKSKKSSFVINDDLLATKAELDALLGI